MSPHDTTPKSEQVLADPHEAASYRRALEGHRASLTAHRIASTAAGFGGWFVFTLLHHESMELDRPTVFLLVCSGLLFTAYFYHKHTVRQDVERKWGTWIKPRPGDTPEKLKARDQVDRELDTNSWL